MRSHLPFFLYLNAFLGVRAFITTTSTPTQCGTFTVNWNGGQPPFVLEILPIQGTQQVFNIPAAAFSNGVGSYSTVLQLVQEQQFLVTMSDATGFATGGISPMLTVQAQTSQTPDCNTGDPSPQFFYSLDFALQQCRPYTFSQYPQAVLPVTIYGLVPAGTAIVLNAPAGATEYAWNPASIAAGTSVVFVMSDARNRTGGVSDIKIAGSTNDTSCLNANSPSVTQQPTHTSSTSTSSASRVPSSKSKSNGSSSGVGNISGTTLIAAIVGALVFLGVLAALGVFLFRRCRKKTFRRRTPNFDVDGGYQDLPSHTPARFGGVDPFPTAPATGTPYEMSPMENSAASLIPHPPPVVATTDSPSRVHAPSANSRKTASMRYQQAQFILHTDADEIAPDENGFIELPPQYSENTRPLPTYRPSGNGAPQSSHTP